MATTKTQPATLPRPLPVFGHTLRFERQSLEFLKSLRPLGDVVTIRLGWEPAYIVNSPDLIRRVLVVEAPGHDDHRRPARARRSHRAKGRRRATMLPDRHHGRRPEISPQWTAAVAASA